MRQSAEPIHNMPTFRYLWEKQLYFYIGLCGYREISETDIFPVRLINPDGSDVIQNRSLNAVTRQTYYQLFSFGVAKHRTIPVIFRNRFTVHAELSGDIFLQKVIFPSSSYNILSDPSHYPVRYHNTPAIITADLRAGLWLFEHFSAGVKLYRDEYRISTNDDRLEQRIMNSVSTGILPYIMLWIPLESTSMKRWSARVTADFIGPGKVDKKSGVNLAELAMFRVSKERSGRATGLFIRYFNSQNNLIKESIPDFIIHNDYQVLIGINHGIGGLNTRRGR